VKQGYQEGPDTCERGETQSDEHLLQCALAPPGCTIDDLVLVNENAVSVATHWFKKNI